MVVELAIIKNRDGITPEEEYADALTGAAHWLPHPELIAKHFIRDGEVGGAVYVWPSKEAAQRAHDDKWREGVLARTGGNPPEIRYFDLMMSCEPPIRKITEYRAPSPADPDDTWCGCDRTGPLETCLSANRGDRKRARDPTGPVSPGATP